MKVSKRAVCISATVTTIECLRDQFSPGYIILLPQAFRGRGYEAKGHLYMECMCTIETGV